MIELYPRNCRKKNKKLTITEITRLQSIFKKKNWPITDDFDTNNFENFCKVLEILNPEEKELFFSLTSDFLWVQDSEYMIYFIKAFNMILSEKMYKDIKKIVFCPLLAEKHFNEVKSSIYLSYKIKYHLSVIEKKYNNYKFQVIDNPKQLKNNDKKDTLILLVDDFIGSGNTAIQAIKYLKKLKICLDNVVILSLVGMEESIINLKQIGIKLYSAQICKKGLTNSHPPKDIRIMKTFEDRIKVIDKYKFGYCQSEALVSMDRIPNNTFPIYWYYNEQYQCAPFLRY